MGRRWQSIPDHLQGRIRSEIGGSVVAKSSFHRPKRNQTNASAGSPATELQRLLEQEFSSRYRLELEYRFLADRKYRIDFAFPDQKVAIEFDGYRSHGISKEGFRNGLRRQNALVCHHWQVLRYSFLDVKERPSEIVAEVLSLLSEK